MWLAVEFRLPVGHTGRCWPGGRVVRELIQRIQTAPRPYILRDRSVEASGEVSTVVSAWISGSRTLCGKGHESD